MDSSGDMSRGYKKKYICLKSLMNISVTERETTRLCMYPDSRKRVFFALPANQT